MKLKLLLVMGVVTLTGCLPMGEDRVTRAVEAAGMTDVHVGGVPLTGCGDDDLLQRTFEATNAKGQPVSGSVCGGVFKGATVRID